MTRSIHRNHRVRLLLAALVTIAFMAALRHAGTRRPRLPDPPSPLLLDVRRQLALDAVLTAEAALRQAPNDQQARLRLADACAAADDPVGAALALFPLLDGINRIDRIGRSSSGNDPVNPSPALRVPDPIQEPNRLAARYITLCLETAWLDEAEAAIQRLPAVPPRLWLDLAAAHVARGDASRAVGLLQGLGRQELAADEWLDGAMTWYHCRRPHLAVAWAKKELAGQGPGAPAAARAVLARCLLAVGQPETALEALLTDMPAGPVDPVREFWRGRAESRCRSEALQVAGRERLARLAAADPANGMAAYEAGRAYLLAGAAERAVPLLSQAAVGGYQEPLSYGLLARTYEALDRRAEALWARARDLNARGQFAQAAAALRRSLELEPGRPLAAVDLARALHAEGRLREAVAVLERAQRLAPDNLDVRLLKAKLLLHQERVQEVIRELEAAATLDPRRANEPLGNLGTVYFDSQQFDRAIPPLERAVQIEDADAHSQFYLGRVYARQLEQPQRAERALRHLLRAARLQPDYSRPWMEAASVLERLGHLSEASACLRRAVAGDSRSDAAYVRLAQLLQRQGRLPERQLILRRYAAVRGHDLRRTGLEKETRDHPKDAARRFALGDLLLREGRPREALPELLAAAGMRPGWKKAWLRLADACALLGYDDMREEAERRGR